MKMSIAVILSLWWCCCGCSVPQYIWPQEDMAFREVNRPALERKILIASRDSEFKRLIVQRIEDAFRQQPVYIRVIGIEDLADEDANRYSAVVLMNTAMGWKADRKVEKFLARHKDLHSIIVLTTADGGDVFPDTQGDRVDALSSASTKAAINPLAEDIIRKISNLIQ